MIKKNDLILAGIILVIALSAALFIAFTKKEGGRVVVMVDGRVEKVLSLYEDTTFMIISEKEPLPPGRETIGGEGLVGNLNHNMLEIKDGKASIIDADCPDKLCMNHGSIRYSHESIVCLPHKVVVEIQDGEESDIDIIAR